MHKLISFLGTINLYLIYTECCPILIVPAQKSMFTLPKQLKAFFATYQPKKPTTSRRGSLTRDTLINMALPITLVVSVSAAVSYLHVVSNLETQIQKQLQKYIVERGQKESSLFLLAQDNHKIFKEDFRHRFQAMGNQDPKERFNQLFKPNGDGTLRLRKELFNGDNKIGGYSAKGLTGIIGKYGTSNLDAYTRRHTVLTYDMLSAYGPGWSSRFPDLYTSTVPENISIIYWREQPWGLNAPADIDLSKEEWVYLADSQNNPNRNTVWTGLLYDSVSQDYIVSCITPIYVDNKHVLTIGNSIYISKLVERAIQEHLEGAYNIVFRADGRLITHPELMEQIKGSLGKFNIRESNDSHLKRIFEIVKKSSSNQKVIENTKDNEYLAITKIEGPDWYFVTVYPKSLMAGLAFDTAKFILFSGLVALAVKILLLLSVLRKKVAKPLNELLTATEQVSSGDFSVHLDTNRQDELGRLAASFTSMASQIQTSFITLEQRVAERTSELQEAKKIADGFKNFSINTSRIHVKLNIRIYITS